jgi:hypothetical protein
MVNSMERTDRCTCRHGSRGSLGLIGRCGTSVTEDPKGPNPDALSSSALSALR